MNAVKYTEHISSIIFEMFLWDIRNLVKYIAQLPDLICRNYRFPCVLWSSWSVEYRTIPRWDIIRHNSHTWLHAWPEFNKREIKLWQQKYMDMLHCEANLAKIGILVFYMLPFVHSSKLVSCLLKFSVVCEETSQCLYQYLDTRC